MRGHQRILRVISAFLLFPSLTAFFVPYTPIVRVFHGQLQATAKEGWASPTNQEVPRVDTSLHMSSAGDSVTPRRRKKSKIPPLRLTRPKRIALMIEPTPFGHVSGYANRFKELIKNLHKAGDHVEILTIDAQSSREGQPEETLGYKIHHSLGFTFPLYTAISLGLDVPSNLMGTFLERSRPDVIHVTSPGVMVKSASLYSQRLGIPLVISYHTHIPTYTLNYMPSVESALYGTWSVIQAMHHGAQGILVTSPQMQQEFTDNGIEGAQVWRKGIDTDRFNPRFKDMEMRNRITNDNPDDFTMIYVGRLGAEKRVADIKDILDKMPDARLCLVGDGPQMTSLQYLFRESKVKFMGQMSGVELSQAFASADAFIMPSDSETLGFVVLESMASGVPVVGCNAGGIPNIITNGTDGFLVEPGDTDGYVTALNKLKDEGIRKEMALNAREEAEDWSWESATSLVRNVVYEEAINGDSHSMESWGHASRRLSAIFDELPKELQL
eukprot:Nitzschia sp. Nitz4//scaffold111_size72815//24603//26166//NITZ4_005785-RA/size72815-snap-gene-0.107-mRNA-1//-1//CDS//3329533165//8548//frame0